MTEVPRFHVEAVDLHGEAPVAMRDALHDVHIGIDFNATPDEITKALQGIMQEAVDSERWHRRGTCDRQQAESRAAPHPESDPL